MAWVCTACRRRFDDARGSCPACGHDVVVPADDPRATVGYLEGLRRRLLAPATADRSLRTDDPRIRLAFRVLLALAALVLLVATLRFLLV